MTNLKLTVSPPNGKPTQGVTLTADDGRQYFEALQLSRGFERAQFVRRAAEHFDVSAGDLSTLDDELVREAIEGAAGGDAIEFNGIMLSELDKQKYEIEYLVEGVLVAGTPTIIGGAMKTLKTSIAVDLAVSLATGRPFLDRFEVNRCAAVAYMSGEGGLSVLQDTCRRVCAAKQVRPDDVAGFVLCDKLPKLDRADHLDGLRRFLEEHEIEVVILDPIYLCMTGADAGNVLSMGERLGAVGEVCTSAGVTPILIHHAKRNIVSAGQFAPGELSDLSWSGFAEFAGSWLLVSRREKYVPSPLAEHRLWLACGGRAGHSSLWGVTVEEGVTGGDIGRYWHVETIPGDEIRQERDSDRTRLQAERAEQRLEDDQRIVVAAMQGCPEGETKTALRDRAGLSGTRFNRVLASLLADGHAAECEVSKAGRTKPYDGYKLLYEGPP